ncbi:MAG: T9SS type A sorting domain-containing protein [Aureispira sp.]
MKILNTLLLFLGSYGILSAQIGPDLQRVQLLLEDALGQKDTIEFGSSFQNHPSTAFTLGMDTAYGEINQYGQVYQSLDARIIQRDSLNYECLKTNHFTFPSTGNLYFPNNLDSKRDFRPNLGGPHGLYNNFEIRVNALHYPVTVSLGEQSILGGIIFSFMLLDSNCNTTNTNYTASSRTQDTLFVLNASNQHTIIAIIDLIVSTNKTQAATSNIQLFPNPAGQYLSVKGLEGFEGDITVLNSLGQQLMHRSFYQENLQLELTDLPKGIYFLCCYNKRTQQTSFHQFIKQSN